MTFFVLEKCFKEEEKREKSISIQLKIEITT
jgi:hypothetical protein